MGRTEFIVATAIILFAAFFLGWFAHWLILRFTKVEKSEMGALEKMAQALQRAKESRSQTAAEYKESKTEMTNRLHQTEAELSAAMLDLRQARREAAQLRGRIEQSHKS